MARRRLNLPWRHPPLESGPVRLGSRRLFILPTRLGLAFAALLLCLLLASINYSISLGYLFTFLLAGVGLSALLHTQRTLLGLILRPTAVTPVFAGESARFRLQVDNPDARFRGAVGLRRLGAPTAETDVAGSATASLEFTLVPPHRGDHRAGRLTVSTCWPLGLFHCWSGVEFDWGVLAYPRPAPDALPFPPLAGAGRSRSGARAGDDEFSGLRPYQPGDALRRIAWKASARGQSPLTKQFASEAGGELWLDWADAPEADSEARLSRLTRWALDAERGGLAWGMRLPGWELPPARGAGHLRQALEALARHGQS